MSSTDSHADRDDLIAYIDGEASPEATARIRATPELLATAAGYVHTQRALLGRLYRFACPSPQALGDYELGLLPPAERTRIAVHITECPRCLDEVHVMRAFLADEPEPAAPGVLTQIRRRIASLLPAPAPLAGLRGANTGTARTYQSGVVTVALDATPLLHGKATLTGLLWREDADVEAFAGSAVTLLAGERLIQTAALDELGNFAFVDLAPGTYTVEVTLGNDCITLEEVHIGL